MNVRGLQKNVHIHTRSYVGIVDSNTSNYLNILVTYNKLIIHVSSHVISK